MKSLPSICSGRWRSRPPEALSQSYFAGTWLATPLLLDVGFVPKVDPKSFYAGSECRQTHVIVAGQRDSITISFDCRSAEGGCLLCPMLELGPSPRRIAARR